MTVIEMTDWADRPYQILAGVPASGFVAEPYGLAPTEDEDLHQAVCNIAGHEEHAYGGVRFAYVVAPGGEIFAGRGFVGDSINADVDLEPVAVVLLLGPTSTDEQLSALQELAHAAAEADASTSPEDAAEGVLEGSEGDAGSSADFEGFGGS